jgi:hypothetical protein
MLIHRTEYEESNHCCNCDSHVGIITVIFERFFNGAFGPSV